MESVCGRPGEPEVLETVTGLVDASLVVPDDAGPEPRFGMLETVRAYAAERLAAAPDQRDTQQRHVDWLQLLAAELLGAHGRAHALARDRLDVERANLRVAVRRLLDDGDAAAVARLVLHAATHLRYRDAEAEAAGWLDRALTSSAGAAPAVRGRLLVLRAVLAGALGQRASVPALLEEGEPLLPAGPDHDLDRALTALVAVQVAVDRGIEEALRAADIALTRFTALGLEIGQAIVRLPAGDLALAAGRPERAKEHYRWVVSVGRVAR